MDEIIKVKNEGYAEYEELLLRRDYLRKEALEWQMEYNRVFGDLITDVFQKKIDCISKKKIISFCQTAINKGETVDQTAMNIWIEEQMKEYKEELAQMVMENSIAKSGTLISEADLSKIKRLYHKLAKILHPDINPKTDQIPELKQLWHMIVVAYNTNSLQDLEDAEVLVKRALETNNIAEMEIEINNLDEKIEAIREEIYQIKETNPYQYKFLLSDTNLVKEKKEALKKELAEYTDYEAELDNILSELMLSGGGFTWRMN